MTDCAEARVRPPAAGRASLAIVLCAALWSTGGLCVKLIDWHPLVIASLRSLLGGLTMLLVVRHPVFTLSFSQVAGGVSSALTRILFICAAKLTTAANAILLQYSAPVFVAILGWLILKEKPYREQRIALGFIVCGIVIFFMDKVSAGGHLGNFLGLASGVTYALYTVFLRMQKDGSPAETIILSHVFAFLFGIPFLFTAPPEFAPQALGAILFLGIFQMGISSLLHAYGIKHLRALQVMLIATLEPVLTPVWVLLFIGEKPSLNAIIGGLLIVASVTLSSVFSARRGIAVKTPAAPAGEVPA